MIVEHKRSGKRHLVDETGLATLCGKTIYRRNFRQTLRRLRKGDCQRCKIVRVARR